MINVLENRHQACRDLLHLYMQALRLHHDMFDSDDDEFILLTLQRLLATRVYYSREQPSSHFLFSLSLHLLYFPSVIIIFIEDSFQV